MNSGPVEQDLKRTREQIQSGEFPQAEEAARTILSRHREHPQAMQLLGVALAGQGRLEEAVAILAETARLRPAAAEVHYNLAKTLADGGRRDESIEAYCRAIQLRPDYFQAHTNLAIALHELGRLDEAVAEYRAAVSLTEDSPEPHYNLANGLKDAGVLDEAIAEYRRALQLQANYPQAHLNLGNALFLKGEIDEARAHGSAAIHLDPAFAEAHNLLGNLAKEAGQLDDALEHYRRAFAARPEPWALGNYLYTLHFHADFDAPEILEEHRRFNELFVRPLANQIRDHSNDRSTSRRLRIGYVSPHFRRHPVGRFVVPLIENHDHKAFEIFCYSGDWRHDEITERLRHASDICRSSVGMSDEQLASQIREDRIDILVDLTMHMENARLLVFARKPAPVQVTYLAYCSTTGVGTIDYRLTDPHLDPPEEDRPFYCEESVYLPRTYWCYEPPAEAPEVGPLPAATAGNVTFACLNNFAKVTSPTLAAWAEVLAKVRESKLLLHCPPGAHRQRVLEEITAQGVHGDRLDFIARIPFAQYLRQHERIDIALDPFPCAGGTTTCDALWMGVPVVSLAGQTAVSRAGLSILSNVGLRELVAGTRESYLEIATSLACNLPRLAELRRTLRDRMRQSPLMDAHQFARDVETAYRKMWATWCYRGR
jgi:predicted O-linked N-acetylglucosamine transferase (SPINDLY family)